MSISKEELIDLRNIYQKGMRVELLIMEDIQAPPVGCQGTVIGVDDIGSIMVKWDNGSSLHIIYGVDKCRIIR